MSRTSEGLTILLRADAKVKPSLAGNLIVDAFVDGTPDKAPAKAKANQRRVPLGTLPAIPFEVTAAP